MSVKKLIKKLKAYNLRKLTAVVMPDFFIDRLVIYKGPLEELVSKLYKVSEKGGGNLIIRQEVVRGGNAANTASALASLGVNTTLIVVTNEYGFTNLKYFMRSNNIDLSRVKILKRPSLTVALEVEYKGRHVNIMLSDPGSLSAIGPKILTKDDWNLLTNADVVGIFNWNQNRRSNSLIKSVFSRLKDGNVLRYLDIGDPTIAPKSRVKELLKILNLGIIDVLSLNENEALYLAKFLGVETNDPRRAAKKLYDRLMINNIDLHTAYYSINFPTEVEVSSLNVNIIKTTGAGDTWNAGNIIGYLLKLDVEERLFLANACAAFYISSPRGEHPTLKKLLHFIQNTVRKHLI